MVGARHDDPVSNTAQNSRKHLERLHLSIVPARYAAPLRFPENPILSGRRPDRSAMSIRRPTAAVAATAPPRCASATPWATARTSHLACFLWVWFARNTASQIRATCGLLPLTGVPFSRSDLERFTPLLADFSSTFCPGVHYVLHRKLEIRNVSCNKNQAVSYGSGGNKPVHRAYGPTSRCTACYNSSPSLRDCAVD